MNKFLNIEQYQTLQELGFNMKKEPEYCWVYNQRGDLRCVMENTIDVHNLCGMSVLPALMLDDVLELLPICIYHYSLYINMKRKEIEYRDESDVLLSFSYGNKRTMLDAAFDALCWSIKNNQ